MGWPNLNIFEVTRRRLAKASAILNIFGVLLCFIVLITGIFIHGTLQTKSHLIEGFNPATLPIFLIAIGVLGTFLSSVGIKVCWTNHKPEKREQWSMYLFIYVICVLILFFSVFIAAIMCFATIGSLRSAFSSGIYSGMKNYYSKQSKKSEIDRLQIDFNCCGSKAYTDWFHISWIHEDYLSTLKKNFAKRNNLLKKCVGGKPWSSYYLQFDVVPYSDNPTRVLRVKTGETYLNDDAPFSCCDPNFDRPCIHHHVHDNDLHYNYDFRTGITLHKTGCTDALMKFYGKMVLLNIGGVIMFVSVIQLIILTMMRFLQTSIDTAIEAGDVEGPSIGYLFPVGAPPGKEHDEDEDRKPLLQSEKEYPTKEDDFDSFDDQFDEDQPNMYKPNMYTEEPATTGQTLPGYSEEQEEHIYSTIPSEQMLYRDEPPADYEEPQIQQPQYQDNEESQIQQPQYQEPVYENVGEFQEPVYENVGEFQDVYKFGQNDPLDDYENVPQQQIDPYMYQNTPQHSFDAFGIPPAPPLPDHMRSSSNQPPYYQTYQND